MKEIIKDKTVVEHYTVYQATDGTEFNSSEECRKYEESALGVIRSKIAKPIVYDTRKISGENACAFPPSRAQGKNRPAGKEASDRILFW